MSAVLAAIKLCTMADFPFVPMTVRHCPPGNLTLRVLKDDLAHAHDPDPD